MKINSTQIEKDEYVVFDDENTSLDTEYRQPREGTSEYWKIIIADDEEEIHQVTKLALQGVVFENKPLMFISAYSGEETHRLIETHPDTAVILLDVVMEEKDSGLKAARYIREDIGNTMVRIILRTGHPGEAPEESVILDYDINDYKLKTELTWEKLFTTIIAALRAYKDLTMIESNRKEIRELYASLAARSNELKKINAQLEKENAERKKVEEALLKASDKRRELEYIINRCPVIVFLRKAEQGKPFEFVSETVSQYGYSPEDFTSGRISMRQIIHPVDIPRVIEEVKQYTAEGKSEFSQEYRVLTASGEIRWADVRTYVRSDNGGNITHYQGIMIDVTVNKEIEKARLDREVAETAARHKGEFLANMSHEIRTPMNAILGLSELMVKTDMTVKQHDYMSKIQTASQALLRIINDILDFSKIEAGKMTLEAVQFDLQDVFDNLTNLFANKADEKGIEFIISAAEDVPYALVGDPYRLGQVLANLTSNAIKFTNKGEIVINANPEEQFSDHVRLRFSVKDTGIGIHTDKISTLFNAFTQEDISTTRKYGGTGLGLTISKQLVELMGGRIWIESELGKGSVFYFTVDLNRQTERKEYQLIIPEEFRGKRVLIVDDNEFSRKILHEFLKYFSFRVTSVDSGEAAIQELRRTSIEDRYQLVLMDWKMPGMDGVETTKRIKADPQLKQLPMIIMVTAFSREEVIRQAEKYVDAFLLKPVKRSILFDTIMNVFGHEPQKLFQEAPAQPEELMNEDKIRFKWVLLVEDNLTNQQVATELLESAGVIVEVAGNGHEAICALGRNNFDAVLMDMQMPEMDGFEATRLIRKDPRYTKLPIIAMTAHAMEGTREKCLLSGMNDYIAKPIDVSQLYSTLARWIPEGGFQPYTDAHLSENPAKEQKEELPKHMPWIDIQSALDRLGGKKRLLKRLIIEFPRDYGNTAAKIKDLLDKGEKETALRLVHTLKGVSGNIGAAELQTAARDLEIGIPEGTPIDRLLNRFQTALDNVLESIRQIEPHENNKNNITESTEITSEDYSAVIPFLTELSDLLHENDLNAEDCLRSIKEYLKNSGFTKELNQLEENINKLDFNAAQMSLAKIAKDLNISLEGKKYE